MQKNVKANFVMQKTMHFTIEGEIFEESVMHIIDIQCKPILYCGYNPGI